MLEKRKRVLFDSYAYKASGFSISQAPCVAVSVTCARDCPTNLIDEF